MNIIRVIFCYKIGSFAMRSERIFQFKSEDRELEVIILEVVDPQYGLFTWPSAVILAQYVWYNRNVLKNKQIIELGSGTALPGVVAALCGANVTLTDGEQFPDCLKNCQETCKANGLKNVKTTALTWGNFSKNFLELPTFDIILGSDCFYDPKDFDDILATVAYLLERNPKGEFWTSYQERSADWSIEILLKKWNLGCQLVSLQTFGGDDENIAGSNLVSNHSIQLLVITHPVN
ncbi:methyltransferase-like protein 23 [Dendronephthya gigantea]|uniref:methyltransferase-like protein 23 n=1 Tax=Dendronephthya gigantea TaxID=151771 RepID=UPI00106BF446|nr:methyltransferase-like protein 23 [Dendronephthya gigantea]